MALNGKGSLIEPLLRPSKNVTINIAQAPQIDDFKIRKVMLKIGGMSCASCAASIESVVGAKEGVENITVSPLQGQAVILYKVKIVNTKMIKEVIEDMGYHVDEFHDQNISVCCLRIKGMACTSCSESVERSLLMVDGVKKAVVGLALEEAKVHFDPNVTNPDRLIEAIEDAGFGAKLISSGDDVNKLYLKVEGIHSQNDAVLFQSSLEAIEGINHVEVDAVGQKVTVTYDPDLIGPRSIIQIIEDSGHSLAIFRATLYSPLPPLLRLHSLYSNGCYGRSHAFPSNRQGKENQAAETLIDCHSPIVSFFLGGRGHG